MINTPHNLANVPAWLLEEEQIERAIARGDRHIYRMLEGIGVLAGKQLKRREEIARQRARRSTKEAV